MSEEIDNWSTCPLEKLTALIKDGSHGTHQDATEGIPLLSAKDVRDGSLYLPDDCRRISEADYRSIHKSYELAKGDILLTVVGSIGRCYLISGNEPPLHDSEKRGSDSRGSHRTQLSLSLFSIRTISEKPNRTHERFCAGRRVSWFAGTIIRHVPDF